MSDRHKGTAFLYDSLCAVSRLEGSDAEQLGAIAGENSSPCRRSTCPTVKAGRLGTTGLPLEPACVWDIEALGVWELR